LSVPSADLKNRRSSDAIGWRWRAAKIFLFRWPFFSPDRAIGCCTRALDRADLAAPVLVDRRTTAHRGRKLAANTMVESPEKTAHAATNADAAKVTFTDKLAPAATTTRKSTTVALFAAGAPPEPSFDA